jgi:hypothetical protein
MNADDLEAVALVVRAVDQITASHHLALSGRVRICHGESDDRLGFLVFNEDSETTWEES